MDETAILSSQVLSLRDAFLIKRASRDTIARDVAKLEQQKRELSLRYSNLDKCLVLFEKVVSLRKKETLEKIEKLVSFGLQRIFDDSSFKFTIESAIRRKQVSYDFKVSSKAFTASEAIPIMDSRGGGLTNIVSFLLRLVILLLTDKKAERFLVLDEPFANLSVKFHENLVAVIRELSNKLDFQFLIISHHDSMDGMADVLYELSQKDGEAVAKRLN